jgi:hypothetical protein
MVPASPKKIRRISQSSPSHYTLHVSLLDIKPAIWRRIHVDGRVRLDAMHHILQAAMGWSDSHLHEFEIRDKHYGIPDPEYPDMEMLDEKKYRLNQLLDVGDHNSGAGNAWVETGERACPPEDAGGSGGYQDMLDTLENEPYSEEAKQLREWVGLDFDPAQFDRLAVNTAISRMLWNGWVKIGK